MPPVTPPPTTVHDNATAPSITEQFNQNQAEQNRINRANNPVQITTPVIQEPTPPQPVTPAPTPVATPTVPTTPTPTISDTKAQNEAIAKANQEEARLRDEKRLANDE